MATSICIMASTMRVVSEKELQIIDKMGKKHKKYLRKKLKEMEFWWKVQN